MNTNDKKKKVLLFQSFLRKHILNFGIGMKSLVFVHRPRKTFARMKNLKIMPTEKIFQIRKTNTLTKIRRIIGIPNIRIRFAKEDIIFTYGCLLITNRPYCTYIENGIALFNYDTKIAAHSIARFLVRFLLQKKSCRKILFMSNTAQKSFLSTMRFSAKERENILKKCEVCHPLIRHPFQRTIPAKHVGIRETVRFLFAGTFYIKGGLEIINAFERIRSEFPNSELSLITATESIWEHDKERIRSIPGVTLLEASFSEEELYKKFYDTHHVFLYPTYRDSFGLVLVEALCAGLPIIGTDQYATGEMIIDGYNGYLLKNHPLKDYNPKTFEIRGHLSEPADFFEKLFALQQENSLKDIEEFLYQSMKKLLSNPALIQKFSENSLRLYREKFDAKKISRRLESVFLEAIRE